MNRFSFFLLFLLFFSCCSDDVVFDRNKSSIKADNSILEQIMSFIELTHHSSNTRSASIEVQITPYVFAGDTIMYVANYDSGWQLFSNCSISPLVLAYSNSGFLDIEKEVEEESPIGLLINMLTEDLRSIANCPLAARINNTTTDSLNHFPPLNINPYGSIDTLSIEIQDHLLITKWGNNAPWNSYTRYVGNRREHAQVGCSAIAVGQYLYYEHFKIGFPEFAMSHATYPTSQDSVFSFSNESSTIWEKMAINRTDINSTHNTDSTAVFLASISESISNFFSTKGTGASISRIRNYLHNQGFDFETVCMDYDYIINSIRNDEPVILSIYNLNNDGHALIADSYKIEHLMTTYDIMSSDGSRDHVVQYFDNKYIRMNWGWDGVSDDVWFVASDAADWYTIYTNPQGLYPNPIHFEPEANRKMFRKNNASVY